MACCVVLRRTRCRCVRHGADGQRVVTQHTVALPNHHESSARPCYLIGESALFEPGIENRLTAIELAAVVCLCEWLGCLHRAVRLARFSRFPRRNSRQQPL